MSIGLHKEVVQSAKPTDMSELISDDETGLFIFWQPDLRTEDFTEAMADLDA